MATRAYKHKKPKYRPVPEHRREGSSHDGFKLAHHEGEWGFVEGGHPDGVSKSKRILSNEESKKIDQAFKRRGLDKKRSVTPPVWE